MDEKYTCYCGLYCENCAVKARVEPAARVLYKEMRQAGFEDMIDMLPDGGGFWTFLKNLAERGACVSCREGSGNPDCAIRRCAQENGIEMCVGCGKYPCAYFDELFACYSGLRDDNALLVEKGIKEWGKLQDERRANGFAYPDERNAGHEDDDRRRDD